MYRINLYREYQEHKKGAYRRALWTGVVASVIAIEIILVGALFLSGRLLSEQAASIRSEIQRIDTRLKVKPADPEDLALARQLLDLRIWRVDWSPKLSALSERIDDDMILDEVAGQLAFRSQPTKFTIRGTVRSGADPLRTASGFVETLRADPRISADFPKVRLGNIGGDEGGRLQIVCETSGDST